MKKILSLFLIIATVFCAAACNTADKYDANVSEFRDCLLIGSGNGYSAEMISGYRENPFEIDGKRSPVTDYSLFTVTPDHFDASKALSLRFTAGGKEYSLTALRHPYKESYSAELPVKITDDAVTINISDGENSVAVELKTVKKGEEISGKKALEIALDCLKTALSPYQKEGKFSGEIFIRYIKNPLSGEQKYYWYVAFIPSADPEKTVAALIDPVSGEVKATGK